MPEQPAITTVRLVLRPLELEDAPRLEAMGNDPEVSSRTSRGEIPGPGLGQFWIENRLAWYEKGEGADFGITLKETGELIGVIGLGMEYPGDESMQLGFWIGKDYWNNGYVTEAALALLPFGFENLRLHRIYSRHFTTNPACSKVLEKIGMTYEGTLREAFKKSGVFESLACYGILRQDYFKSE